MHKRILLRIEERRVHFSLLVGFPAGRPELSGGFTLAVSFGHEINIIDPAVASHSTPAVLDEVCVVDQIENWGNWRPLGNASRCREGSNCRMRSTVITNETTQLICFNTSLSNAIMTIVHSLIRLCNFETWFMRLRGVLIPRTTRSTHHSVEIETRGIF